jgi:lipopolysaccharide transport system ATP-binding protein
MGSQEISRKFHDIVAFAEMDKFIDTPVKRYSSGMYVRLAFAVAAHLEPDILLLDEVLAVGDLSFQRKCMEHAKRLLRRKSTVLLVSHNMFAIKAMCRRVLYLAHGTVGFDGAPEEAIQRYEEESRLDVLPWAQATLGSDPARCAIRVTEMAILDEDGRPCTVFEYGARLRIRLQYDVREPIDNPNFVVALVRSDNVVCCHHSTTLDGFETARVSGAGSIEVVTPPLRLVNELYSVHVIIWDAAFQRLYGAQVGNTFHVRHEMFSKHFGVFYEPGRWSWPAGGPCPGASGPAAAAETCLQ